MKAIIGFILGITFTVLVLGVANAEREPTPNPSEGQPCICPPEDSKPNKQL